MSKKECKYKFQNAEKFDGKTYCTCLNELCKNISFCCDNNCQIYEDYKQLQVKEQECEELKFTIKHTGLLDLMNKNVELRKALDEIKKMCKDHPFCDCSCGEDILNIINKAKEN